MYKVTSDEELAKILAQSRRKYLALRFQKKANELKNPSYIMKEARRDIARILTEVSYRKKTRLIKK